MNIPKLLEQKKVLVCCGSGGVGKTTTSAALAITAAREGKRAVVITIDPAKRLATSLGIEGLKNTPTDITDKVNAVLSNETLPGTIHAVMPDTAETFERFVKKMAKNDERLINKIIHTTIYKIFTKEFSGTNEYMAMEKLFELYSENKFDTIILDTPPSANTKSFLLAPQMLADFFDDRIIKWFVKPGSSLISSGLKKALEILEKLTGKGFISDLLDFTAGLFELRNNFIDNLRSVRALLHQDDVAFLMVTSPERLSKQDTIDFVAQLKEEGFPFAGFILNRVLSEKLGIPKDTKFDVQGILNETKSDSAKKAYEYLIPTLIHEQQATDFLSNLETETPVARISENSEDIHSIKNLLVVSNELRAQ